MNILHLLLVTISTQLNTATGDCVTTFSLSPNRPIITTSIKNKYELLYPNQSSKNGIFIPSDTNLLISCTNTTFSRSFENRHYISATCSNNILEAEGHHLLVNLPILLCKNPISITAQYTNNTCKTGAKELEIGYEIFPNRDLVRTISLCFDQQYHNTLYATHNITRFIGNQKTGAPALQFSEGSFYADIPVNVADLYDVDAQRSTINQQLGLPLDSFEYIKENSTCMLEEGHLSPPLGFVYDHQQNSTFYDVNAAPQWRGFSLGNWASIEKSTQDYAKTNKLDLVVYTGTYGVATLPHAETGEETELWLFVDDDRKGIAVPELFWKVVFEPIGKKGVVFVGVNNPYEKDVVKNVICKDVGDEITWAKWDRNGVVENDCCRDEECSIQSGYVYACEVDDFRDEVEYLPEFEVSGLLV